MDANKHINDFQTNTNKDISIERLPASIQSFHSESVVFFSYVGHKITYLTECSFPYTKTVKQLIIKKKQIS